MQKSFRMAKIQNWQDDYWLLLMQIYLRRPVGLKPLYSKVMVELSLELHITPEALNRQMRRIDTLDTPRIERIWREYSRNPKRLSRAVQLLRSMMGFNSSGDFYEGVEVEETFERDFRPIEADERLMPISLVLILNLYFLLTPNTMVEETPEVKELARLMKVPASLIVEVLDIFQHCDPYLNRQDVIISQLLMPCQQVWQRYGNGDTQLLATYASQLEEYFK